GPWNPSRSPTPQPRGRPDVLDRDRDRWSRRPLPVRRAAGPRGRSLQGRPCQRDRMPISRREPADRRLRPPSQRCSRAVPGPGSSAAERLLPAPAWQGSRPAVLGRRSAPLFARQVRAWTALATLPLPAPGPPLRDSPQPVWAWESWSLAPLLWAPAPVQRAPAPLRPVGRWG